MAKMSNVAACLFTQSDFVQLDNECQTLYLFLLCGPLRPRVPGILWAGPAGIAERQRRPEPDTYRSLRRLGEANFIKFDEINGVIQLKYFYDVAINPNVLSGWYRDWAEIPSASPLPLAHIVNLIPHIPGLSSPDPRKRQGIQERWNATFHKHFAAWILSHVDTIPGLKLKVSEYVKLGVLAPDVAQAATGGESRVVPIRSGVTENPAHPPAPPAEQINRDRDSYSNNSGIIRQLLKPAISQDFLPFTHTESFVSNVSQRTLPNVVVQPPTSKRARVPGPRTAQDAPPAGGSVHGRQGAPENAKKATPRGGKWALDAPEPDAAVWEELMGARRAAE